MKNAVESRRHEFTHLLHFSPQLRRGGAEETCSALECFARMRKPLRLLIIHILQRMLKIAQKHIVRL